MFPLLILDVEMVGIRHLCCHWYNIIYAGYLIQLMSFGSFISLAAGSPAKFAILFSFGTIISIAA